MGFTNSNKCIYCSDLTDDYYHALWSCIHIQRFWVEVINCLSEILNLDIPLCPVIALLNNTTSLGVSKHLKSFISIALTLAKKTILINWKNRTEISKTQWLAFVTDYSNLEKLTSSLKNKIKIYEDTWTPFLQYLKQ